MALPKAHHIETLSEFNSLKFSYDSTNTHYFTGGTDTIVEGTPDILYTDIAYIKSLSCIYTHAKIYPCPVLEYDNTPTANSTNLVNSGNIKNAIDGAISGKQDTITGGASSITTANLTASKLLGSDANGKVAATSIATADAEDAVSKRHTQNTDTKIVSGNNKVEVSASGTAITGNGSVSGNLSISGNLNVTGKETVEEIVNIKSENNFITLRDGAQTAIASGSLSGTKVENYDGLGNDLLFGTDASGTFRIGDEGGTLEPIATRDEASNLTDGQLMKWDAANQRLVGTSDIAPQINSYVASKAMTEDAYWDLVAAGTVQQNTLYITYDNDWEG